MNQVHEYLIDNYRDTDVVSVSLNSRQWCPDYGSLDEIKLSNDIRYFLNRLNFKLFKRQFTKHKKMLGCKSVIQGDGVNKHFHCHLELEKPTHLSIKEFSVMINECWGKTRFGRMRRLNVDVRENYNKSDWLGYITREKNLKVDWLNCNDSTVE